jgi:hypothetical protein
MKPMRLVVALATLALLGGAIWYSDKHPPKADSAATEAKPAAKMLSIKEDQINAIHILHPDTNASVTLDKDIRGTWTIREPKEMAADPTAAKALAAAFAGLESEQVVSDKTSDWASYGLDQPKLVVQATLADGKKAEVDLGNDAPTGSPTYARVNGNGVPAGSSDKLFGVSSAIKGSLDKSAADLRDKRLLRVDVDRVSKVLLTNQEGAKGKQMEFARSGTEWQFVQPHTMQAENYAVEDLVRTASNAYDSVVAEDDKDKDVKKYDFSKPWATIEAVDPAGSHRLTIVQEIVKADKSKPGSTEQKNYYVKTSEMPGVYKILPTTAATLGRTVESFRRTAIFEMSFADPDKLEMRSDNTRITIERKPDKDKKGDQWLNGTKPVNSEKVQVIINLMRRLSAKSYPSDEASEQAKYGLDKPTVDVKVTIAGKTQHLMLVSQDGKAYVAREGDPTTYEVDNVEFGDLKRLITEVK